MEQHVMSSTEQYAIREVGLSPDAEWGDVVGFAPGRGPIAARPAASAVSKREGSALGPAEQAPGAPQIEGFTHPAQNNWEGTTVAQITSCGCS
jgi:hypothetical protein